MSRWVYGQADPAVLPTTPETRGRMLVKGAVGTPTAEYVAFSQDWKF